MKNVLITGAGSPGGPGIIKAVNQKYCIHGADADAKATGKGLCAFFHCIPKAQDKMFIPTILNIVKDHNIDLIIPLVTKELEYFSSHIVDFENLDCHVVVNSIENLNICNDKNLLLQKISEAQLLTPKFTAVTTSSDLTAAAASLNYPKDTICIKPSQSNGMRGFRILDNSVNKAELFWNEKPNNTYSTLPDLIETLGDTFREILVMEYLPGDEYTIDCIAHKGKAILILPRKRIKMNNGISIRGKFVNHKEIIDYCEKIISLFQLHGPVGIQLREDRNGIPKMLEINPRLQGTTVATEGLGINIPELIINQALGNEPVVDTNSIPWGREFGRYYTEIFWD